MNSHPPASDRSLSIWIEDSPVTKLERLERDVSADVAIVGGGITGLTAAYLLARAGASVVLVDKGRIGLSESGHTTAHIVESTDADYRELVRAHGEEGARLNTAAIRAAMQQIRACVTDLSIDCGYAELDGFLYAERESDRGFLERQQDYLERAGVATEWISQAPLPFPTIGALRFRRQATFQIRDYLLGLANAARRLGARIFEDSLVMDVSDADSRGLRTVRSDRAAVQARSVLLATHIPINDRTTLWAKLHATRTYVVAAPIEPGAVINALYWDTPSPYHYTRLFTRGDRQFLIVGGEDRDVGDEDNDTERYAALEAYCYARFGLTDFSHHWSGQINQPADEIPFIGQSHYGDQTWMATGYSGTGMTYGTLGGMMLADFALGAQSEYASLYNPRRKQLRAMVETIVTKATKTPKRLISKVLRTDVETESLDDVPEGQGRIVSVAGRKVAAARVNGSLTQLDPTCTHMGCTVSWNTAEQSWDCQCHGSRFTTQGEVLNGPATRPLKRTRATRKRSEPVKRARVPRRRRRTRAKNTRR